jgi:hypothetical protein
LGGQIKQTSLFVRALRNRFQRATRLDWICEFDGFASGLDLNHQETLLEFLMPLFCCGISVFSLPISIQMNKPRYLCTLYYEFIN